MKSSFITLLQVLFSIMAVVTISVFGLGISADMPGSTENTSEKIVLLSGVFGLWMVLLMASDKHSRPKWLSYLNFVTVALVLLAAVYYFIGLLAALGFALVTSLAVIGVLVYLKRAWY